MIKTRLKKPLIIKVITCAIFVALLSISAAYPSTLRLPLGKIQSERATKASLSLIKPDFFYNDLEEVGDKPYDIDEALRSLEARQDKDGFGFAEYWEPDSTIKTIYRSYGRILSLDREGIRQRLTEIYKNDRDPESDRKLKNFLAEFFEEEESTKAIDERRLGNFIVRKSLWRVFRKIGFPGTKLKGDPEAVNDGCFICIPNTAPSQKGICIFDRINNAEFVALVNPFQILRNHITLALIGHEPQEISSGHIRFILDLTQKSKSFRFAFNSIGAAASIPKHLHFQGSDEKLPIEEIGEVELFQGDGLKLSKLDELWPNLVYVARGDSEKVAAFIMHMINGMAEKFPEGKNREGQAFNILFSRDKNGEPKTYFIPRRKERPSNFGNDFGFCEMGGLMLCEKTKDFDTANPEDIRQALSECGYAHSDAGEIEAVFDSVVNKNINSAGSPEEEIFKGLNLNHEEGLAMANQYPHLENRFMLPVEGDIATEFINPALSGLTLEELENIANRFVVGLNMTHETVLDKSDKVYPCFQVYSHARKPYFILPGDGIVINLPNGEKKRIRYIGYLGGGLVFSKTERERRSYTQDGDGTLINETFGIGLIGDRKTNLGLVGRESAKKRFIFLKEMYDRGESEIPMFLLMTKLKTVRDLYGREIPISELEEKNEIIPDQTPSVAIMGYEGLETIRDLDSIPSYFLEQAVERNKRQAQEREDRKTPFTNEEFLSWFSEGFAARLARLVNLGIFRGNLSPQNVTFFEVTDFDMDHVARIEDYDDIEAWDDALFVHFFQGYVTLISTFELFSEKLAVDKSIKDNIKKVYFESILGRLNEMERATLIKAILRNKDIEEGKASLYFKVCDSNYKMLQEFIEGFVVFSDDFQRTSVMLRQQI